MRRRMTSTPPHGRGPRTFLVPLAFTLVAMTQGCVSTEALYAEYDEHACRVVVEETSPAGDAAPERVGVDRRGRNGTDSAAGPSAVGDRAVSTRKGDAGGGNERRGAAAER